MLLNEDVVMEQMIVDAHVGMYEMIRMTVDRDHS